MAKNKSETVTIKSGGKDLVTIDAEKFKAMADGIPSPTPPDELGLRGKGVEREYYPDIEAAADQCEKLEDRKSLLAEECKAAAKKLHDLMRDKDVTEYRYANKLVTRKPQNDKIKIKRTADYVVSHEEGSESAANN